MCPLDRYSIALALCAGFVWSLPLTTAHAQERQPYQISGVVNAAETREPLAGAQVFIRGTELGALTNAQGRFSITAPLPAGEYAVDVSFLGRETVVRSVTLAADRIVNLAPIFLDEAAVELRELVVSAAGVRSERRALGNTVETIRGEQVATAPAATTIDQALQGKVTGAVISETSGQAGGGVTIRLRGVSSILGGADPLIVVDGVIIDNNNEALISVAGNAGRGSQSLTNRLADLSPGDIDRINILKGASAAALYGARANNGVIQIFTKQGQQGDTRFSFRSEASFGETPDTYDLVDIPFAGLADVIWGGAAAVGAEVERFPIQDEVFRTSQMLNNRLSISGGSGPLTYYLSGGYLDEQGMIVGNDYSKLTTLGKVSAGLTDRLSVVASANYIRSEYSFIPEGEQTEGVLTSVIFTPTSFNPFFDEELGRFPFNPLLGANPFDVIENWETSQEVSRFIGHTELAYRFSDDLELQYLFGFDEYRQQDFRYHPPFSTSTRDPGTVTSPIRFSRQLNHDLVLNHVQDWGERLRFNTTIGAKYLEDQAEITRAAASDLPFGQRLVAGATQFASQSFSEVRTYTSFIQEQIAINDRLFFTGGLNLEGNSAFGEDERWQLFPRLSASWVLHEEPFFAESGVGDAFSTLRLRAAYGETGGEPPGAFTRFENYGDVAFAGKPGLVPSNTAGNPNLEPEREREFEGGVDLGFFDDRLQLELTGYTSRTTNLVLPVRLPPSRGVQTQLQNIGELRNWGWETAIETVNMSGPNFAWRSRLSMFGNDSEVEELVTAADTLGFGYLNIVAEGLPIGVFYGWFYERGPDGEIVIDPATGMGKRAVGEDGTALKKVLGNPTPDLEASFTNTFQIGDALHLNVLLDGRFGNEVANFSRRIQEFFGVAEIVEQEILRAKAAAEGQDVEPLKITLNRALLLNYERYVQDGSYVKLREIGLTYGLPQQWFAGFGAESARLTVAGRNLFTWTDYDGLDPEVNLFASNTVAQGVDFATTPLPRAFSVAIDVTF